MFRHLLRSKADQVESAASRTTRRPTVNDEASFLFTMTVDSNSSDLYTDDVSELFNMLIAIYCRCVGRLRSNPIEIPSTILPCMVVGLRAGQAQFSPCLFLREKEPPRSSVERGWLGPVRLT